MPAAVHRTACNFYCRSIKFRSEVNSGMATFVPGEGPRPNDLMFVGEGPGVEEDKAGRCWVGKAGKELWAYTWQALHRKRDSIFATNLIKYHIPDDGDPTDDDIRRDSPILDKEIRAVNPKYIATLGGWSTRYLLGPCEMEVVHGIPHLVGNRVVVPVFHPASGLHNTENQAKIAWDMEQLAKVMRGEIKAEPPLDDIEPHYGPLSLSTKRGILVESAAVDTEGTKSNPWCLTFAMQPGKAAIVRQPGRIRRFKHAIMHFLWLNDLGALRTMGVEVDSFDDTAIMAYLLCIEPQGLKALCKRHCGMDMLDYEDLTREASRRHAMDYLVMALGAACDNQLNSASSESSTTLPKSRKRTRASGGKKSAKSRPKAGKK